MAVTKTNGNGFALYGGVMLPNIESVWDQETYPYAALVVADGATMGEAYAGSTAAQLLLSGSAITLTEGGVVLSNGHAIYATADTQELADCLTGVGIPCSVGEWALVTSGSDSADVSPQPTWTSADILNADGTVYLAATDPIPLDGMTVITWDGDTTGLEVAPGGGVRIADYESASSAFVCISAEGMTFMIDGFRRQEPTFPGWAVALEGSAVVLAYETDIVSSTLPTIRSGIWSTGAEPGAMFYLAYVPEGTGGGEEDAFDLTAFLTGLALGLASHGCGYTHTGTDPEGRGFEAGQALRQLRGT